MKTAPTWIPSIGWHAMADILLHHEGAYNFYCTVSDGPVFQTAVTRDQLEEYYRREYGERGMRDLPERLKRAHEKGSSGFDDRSLADAVMLNEEELSTEEFIQRYLTLPVGPPG